MKTINNRIDNVSSKEITKVIITDTGKIINPYFYIINSVSNCKLVNLEYLSIALSSQKSTDTFVKILKNYQGRTYRRVFNCSLIKVSQVRILMEHFKLVGLSKIPIGYGSGYQYMCTFALADTERIRNCYNENIDYFNSLLNEDN